MGQTQLFQDASTNALVCINRAISANVYKTYNRAGRFILPTLLRRFYRSCGRLAEVVLTTPVRLKKPEGNNEQKWGEKKKKPVSNASGTFHWKKQFAYAISTYTRGVSNT